MIPAYLLLARRIRDELVELERVVNRSQNAWKTFDDDPQQVYAIDAVALNLHGFYSGLERILENVAIQIDGELPKGQSWHKELLHQMSDDIPDVRPPVFSKQFIPQIDEFLRFRHLVRNLYADYLEPNRVGKLVVLLTTVWPQLQNELNSFATFLENVSKADDAV